jgi:hypothetical protein
MRSNKLASISFLALIFSACSVQSVKQDTTPGSSLTSIDVNLPAKDKLPKGLQGENLMYCFSVNEGPETAYQNYNGCITPYGAKDTFKKGPYTGAIKLDAKLDSSKEYYVTLMVGYEGNAQDGTGTVKPIMTLMAPDSISSISNSNPSVLEFDTSRIHYSGHKSIKPADMSGLSKLQVSIDLIKIGTTTEEDNSNPDSITTGKELDLEVTPVFKDSSSEGNSENNGPAVSPI